MRRIIEIIAAIAIVSASLSATPAHAAKQWKPCKYEDSLNCVWDARHMGNGHGRSLVAYKSGKIVYISHARAHRMLGL